MKEIFPILLSANKFSTYTFSDRLSLQIIFPTRKPSYLSAAKESQVIYPSQKNLDSGNDGSTDESNENWLALINQLSISASLELWLTLIV